MYQFVNAITCEITDQASTDSVFGFLIGRSRMSSYLGHLHLLSMSLRSTPCISVNVMTCEITDQASPNSVCAFFMDFIETVHICSLRGSNMNQTICFKQAFFALGGALVIVVVVVVIEEFLFIYVLEVKNT